MKSLKNVLKSFQKTLRNLPDCVTVILHWICMPLLINTALNVFFFVSNRFNGSRHFGGLFFSYLFTIVLYVLLLTVCHKETVAAPILGILYFVLGYVNQIKMVISGMNPIFISDLLFVSDTESISVMVTNSNLWGTVVAYLPETLLFLFLLAIPLSFAFIADYRIRNRKIRFISLATTLLALLLTFVPIKPLHHVTYSLFFGEKAGHDPVAYYNEKGFISGLIGQYWNSHPLKADTKKEASEILGNTPETPQGNWGKPNIIVIFSESFFDVSKLSDVELSKPPTAHYNTLKEQGVSFSILSPTIGGLSCNCEYQILTGANMAFHPLGTVPYTMNYTKNNANRYSYPAVIRDLKQNGYETEIVSTWARNLCNCDVVYESMGLDTFVYDYGEEIKGLYYSDKTVGDKIKSTFDEKEHGSPLFYFTQTSQAHMPYYADKYDNYDVDILSSPFNDTENGIFQSYVQGIYDADLMLADIYAYIKTLEEPTVLLFFGDHLPTLTDCGRNLFDKLAYFNTDDSLLNETRRYTTEGLILANFSLSDDVDYLGQDMMLPYLLSHTSVNLSPYYQYLVSIRDTLPALGTFAAYGQDGTLYSLDHLPDEMFSVYQEREKIHHALFDSD